jgi:hypothetical protein
METPLHIAASYSAEGIARVLLKYGSDVNARDHLGSTALHMAASLNDHGRIVQLLLHKGADATICDDNGNKARGMADQRGRQDIVALFDNVHVITTVDRKPHLLKDLQAFRDSTSRQTRPLAPGTAGEEQVCRSLYSFIAYFHPEERYWGRSSSPVFDNLFGKNLQDMEDQLWKAKSQDDLASSDKKRKPEYNRWIHLPANNVSLWS